MPRIRSLTIPVLLALASVAAMGPIVGNGFVEGWDDGANFLENRQFLGLGGPQLKWAWTTRKLGVYQPVAWMILEAESVVFGLDPRGYHAVSVALHAINAILVYLLIRRLLDRSGINKPALPSALAACLWAVNPLRVEAVAWASCQPYLPCTTLMLGSVLAYLKADENRAKSRRSAFCSALSLVLFAAAGLSKAAAVGLPLVLIILDHHLFKNRRIGAKIPFFVIAIVLSIVAIWARAEPPPDPNVVFGAHRPDLVERLTRAAYGLDFYVLKTVIPIGLTAFHVAPEPFDPLEFRFALAISAAIGGIVSVAIFSRRWPLLAAGSASYVALVFPCLGLVPFGDQLTADRYAYAATIPLFALLAGVFTRISDRRWIGIALIVAIVFIFLSRSQCRTWRDTKTLKAHALEVGMRGPNSRRRPAGRNWPEQFVGSGWLGSRL